MCTLIDRSRKLKENLSSFLVFFDVLITDSTFNKTSSSDSLSISFSIDLFSLFLPIPPSESLFPLSTFSYSQHHSLFNIMDQPQAHCLLYFQYTPWKPLLCSPSKYKSKSFTSKSIWTSQLMLCVFTPLSSASLFFYLRAGENLYASRQVSKCEEASRTAKVKRQAFSQPAEEPARVGAILVAEMMDQTIQFYRL